MAKLIDALPPLPPLELQRVAPMPEAEHLSGLSRDLIERYHRDKIVRLSPNRVGMRVGDALNLRHTTNK